MTADFERQILEIYTQYHDTVKNMVITLETEDGEYPVEILNEIRAIMNHLAKCYIADNNRPNNFEKTIEKNIARAQGHLRRAIYDCYKYGCISVEDYYTEFHLRMKHVDLGVVDNGDFVIRISKKYREAKRALKAAKREEQGALDSSLSDAAYNLYEEAYMAYNDLRDDIEGTLEKIERARHKQVLSWWINVGFGIAGVIGVILTLLGMLMS